MNFLIKTIKGMIIGVAAMTAGAGTFAIILGVYYKCMEIIAKPFKNFKENLIYVAPIVLGILISALVFGRPIAYAYEHYNSYMKVIFLGVILGGIPQLIKIANKKGFNKKMIIALILAIAVTGVLQYLGSQLKEGEAAAELGIIPLIIYGIIFGFGAVMPGMTTIHILVYMGVMGKIMDGIFAVNLGIIIPFGIGYLIIVLLTANLITYLFKKFYGITYYAIIGFAVISLAMLIPTLTTTAEYILCPIYALAACAFTYYASKLEDKYSKD